MNKKVKIIEKDEMKIIGLTLFTSFTNDQSKKDIPPFFHNIIEKGSLNNVPNRINTNQLCVFQMKRNCPDFSYTMGVEVDRITKIPKKMDGLVLKKSKYVSIEIIKKGHSDVGNAFNYIFKEWIPNSVYIPTGEPAFIYYDDRYFSEFNKDEKNKKPIATIYVPIKPFFIKRVVFGFKNFVKKIFN
jgi:predicted transcriptional regulator YdeE